MRLYVLQMSVFSSRDMDAIAIIQDPYYPFEAFAEDFDGLPDRYLHILLAVPRLYNLNLPTMY